MDHVEGVVHVTLDGINETRVFLELTFPVFDVLHAFLGELGRKSQLLHLGCSGYLTDKELVLLGILCGSFATTVVHALTVETLLMACGSHDLCHQSMDVIVIMLVVVLLRHIDSVPLGVIMCHAGSVHTNIHEVVTHLQDEVIDGYLGGGRLDFPTVCQPAIGLDLLVKGFLIDHRKGCLLDVEQDAYLSVADDLVVRLLFRRKCLVVFTANLHVRIFLALVLVPVVPIERNTFLT